MRAIFVDQSALLKLAFGELPEPKPEHNQAIVTVAAVSLNRGEIAHVSSSQPSGASIGWDFAGSVEQPAGDGSGPKAGAQVVGASNQKSFAEQVAATASEMAELPDSVSFQDAATLPVAGLTAFVPLLRHSEAGRIVNMSSSLGSLAENSDPSWEAASIKPLAYNSSKAALNIRRR